MDNHKTNKIAGVDGFGHAGPGKNLEIDESVITFPGDVLEGLAEGVLGGATGLGNQADAEMLGK